MKVFKEYPVVLSECSPTALKSILRASWSFAGQSR